jgi:hypothetical protein
MPDDPRIDELLATNRTPQEVYLDSPELLSRVRSGLWR